MISLMTVIPVVLDVDTGVDDACALLLAAIASVGDAARTQALEDWIARLTVLLGICTIWAIAWTTWPGPEPTAGAEPATVPSSAAGR